MSDSFSDFIGDPSGFVPPRLVPQRPEDMPVAKVTTKAEADALTPGRWFLDPAGTKRQRPYDISDPAGISKVPEGSWYNYKPPGEPSARLSRKPMTEPLNVGGRILYGLGGDDPQRQKILSYLYPEGDVQKTPEGFRVKTPDGKWHNPDKGGMGPFLGGAAGLAAPMALSTAGATLGGTVGSTVPGVGTFGGATLGSGAGAVAGQAFNDMLLGLFGVTSTEDETRQRMDEAAIAGATGEGLGRIGIATATPVVGATRAALATGKSESFKHIPAATLAWILGAGQEETRRAAELGKQGIRSSVSSYLFEAPYWKKVMDEFYPTFYTGPKNMFLRSYNKYYEETAKTVGQHPEIGVRRTEPYLGSTKAVDVEETGVVVQQKLADDLARDNDALARSIDARKTELQTYRYGEQSQKESTLSMLQAASSNMRQTAQRAVDNALSFVDRQLQQARRQLGLGENPSDLWVAAGEKLEAVKAGFSAKAAQGYTAAHNAAGPIPMHLGGVVQEASDFIAKMPEGLEDLRPALTNRLARISQPIDTGLVDAAGNPIIRIPDVTLEQAHELRNWVRDLAPQGPNAGAIEGAKTKLAGMVNRWMHDPNQPAAVKAGVAIMDDWDRYYKKNIVKWNQQAAQTIAEKMRNKQMEDAPALVKLIFDNDSTINRETMRKLLSGPLPGAKPETDLWRYLVRLDGKRMIDASRDNLGNVDGARLSGMVLDRVRSGRWDPGEVNQDILDIARRQAMLQGRREGRVLVEQMPGDTVSSLLQRVQAMEEETKALLKYDPMKLLQKEMGDLDKEFTRGKADNLTRAVRSKLGFVLNPTMGPIEAANKILSDSTGDLINAAAQRFGIDSVEMNMIRQAYVEKMFTEEKARFIKQLPESVQSVLFPGITKDQAVVFADTLNFVLGTGKTFGGGIAAAGRVLQPQTELRHISSPVARAVAKLPIGGDLVARLTIGQYYKAMTWLGTHPKFTDWLARGLEGTAQEKQTAKEAFLRLMGIDNEQLKAIGGHIGRTIGVLEMGGSASPEAGGGDSSAAGQYQPPSTPRPGDEALRSLPR